VTVTPAYQPFQAGVGRTPGRSPVVLHVGIASDALVEV